MTYAASPNDGTMVIYVFINSINVSWSTMTKGILSATTTGDLPMMYKMATKWSWTKES
jgi:hypothetical protein